MAEYATVLDALRSCANGECEGCPCADKCEKYIKKALLPDAADAIEELLAERDDWETIAKHKSKIIKKMESEQSEIMQQLPTWVSVEERLPEIGEIVLAYVDELRLIIRAKIVDAKDYRGERRIDWARVDPDPFFLSCYTITHWMPLPKPPTEPKGVE